MIAIDVGCDERGADSISYIISEFHPDVLYGFDPHEAPARERMQDGTKVIIEPKACWTHDGWIGYTAQGFGITREDENLKQVRCIDLSRFILSLGQDDLVLKIDAEGAEYPLLEHLIQTGAIDRVKTLWLEWHFFDEDSSDRKRRIVEALKCEIIPWNL